MSTKKANKSNKPEVMLFQIGLGYGIKVKDNMDAMEQALNIALNEAGPNNNKSHHFVVTVNGKLTREIEIDKRFYIQWFDLP